jgi:HSP20 family protein
MSKKNTKEEDKKPEIDLEFSTKGLFGGFLKGLGSLIDLADKVSKESGEIKKQGEFGIKGQKDLSGVYGFSIKTMTGPGGIARPIVRPFGDISKFKDAFIKKEKTSKSPIVTETREPVIDIFDEKEFIRVIAELPGVNNSEINCEVFGDDIVEIRTTGKQKYYKEILLESKIEPKSLEKNYVNGVLEIKVKKTVIKL